MTVTRHFLGWDGPLAERVGAWLLARAETTDGALALGDTLIVAPTRQAGRRLREALASAGAARGVALLAARVVQPTFFLVPQDSPATMATPSAVKAVWAETLLAADLDDLAALFPVKPAACDFGWALRLGDLLQQLRATLAEGGYRIADVLAAPGGPVEEADRWRNLATLEESYLRRLTALNLDDPCLVELRQSTTPALPEDVRRIVVAAVPDPTLLLVRALETLAARVPVEILMHAPGAWADRFDAWGRPIPERWRSARFDWPEATATLALAGTPAGQSRKTLDLIAAHAAEFGPLDIAVGVPDRAVTPFLRTDFEAAGLAAFDPAGKPVREHAVCRLLDVLRGLAGERLYRDFSALLRQADVLAYLHAEKQAAPDELLRELDEFQNAFLPQRASDLVARFADAGAASVKRAYPQLALAVECIGGWLALLGERSVPDAAREVLRAVYATRRLDPSLPADREFTPAAQAVDDALHEWSESVPDAARLDRRAGFDLLMSRLGELSYEPERGDAPIELEGWLELPWNDAPLLIVTGMNEGLVPAGRVADAFLPDTLRARLGLRHDAERYARDLFLMRGLIESRRRGGRVAFIVGRTGQAGDPLKPSRLLFHCADSDLPERVARLFGEVAEPRDNTPLSIGFRLDPRPPSDVPPEAWRPTTLSVTAFKAYLACPFRFYLSHVLGMAGLADNKIFLDASDFGQLLHAALHGLSSDTALRRCADERVLAEFLRARAEAWVKARYGASFSPAIAMQLEAAKQRLTAAARAQAREAAAGWEIARTEVALTLELDGLKIEGRIDRVDRHSRTGAFRILDYKSSEKAAAPEVEHLGGGREEAAGYAAVVRDGKAKQWVDLQLPLYRLMAERTLETGACAIGYFHLPKAVGETGIALWEGFDADLARSAETCARGVIGDLRAGRFWPPAERVLYDDFASLFPAGVEACVDEAAFQQWMAHFST